MSDVFAFEFEQIRSAAGARWMQRAEPPSRSPRVAGVGIDSREDLAGKAFIAIKGETHDGHDHLAQAVSKGATLLVVETAAMATRTLPNGVAAMQVESTRRALGRIAHAHRQSLRGIKVIGITGSSGKTTTKRLVQGVLATTFAGVSSPRSFNNDIGVPLTLLAAKSSDKYVVVEIGTSGPGEIAALSKIAEPDIAIVTMIGRSHLEGLGSVEGVAREKGSLLDALDAADGVAIVNADAMLLRPHLKRLKFKFLFGEMAEADLRLTARGVEDAGAGGAQWIEVNGRSRFRLALPGRHNALNALAAIAVARRFGLHDEAIAAGLLSVQPEAMRMTAQNVGGVSFHNDAYNANPDSMIAALDTFVEVAADAPRRIIVLGDMLELGDESAALHREVAAHVSRVDHRAPFAHMLLVGPQMQHAADELRELLAPGKDRVSHAANVDDAVEIARRVIRRDDAVLVKASRGMGLERLIATFEAEPVSKPRRRKVAAA